MGWVSVHAPSFLARNVLHCVVFIVIVYPDDYFEIFNMPYDLVVVWYL